MSIAPLSINSFVSVAKSGEAVQLTEGKLQSATITPAKQGFISKVLNWCRGTAESQINRETRKAFLAAVGQGLMPKDRDSVLAAANFDVKSSKPLSSREINNISAAKASMVKDLGGQMAIMQSQATEIKKDLNTKVKLLEEKKMAFYGAPAGIRKAERAVLMSEMLKVEAECMKLRALLSSKFEGMNVLLPLPAVRPPVMDVIDQRPTLLDDQY